MRDKNYRYFFSIILSVIRMQKARYFKNLVCNKSTCVKEAAIQLVTNGSERSSLDCFW